MNTLERIEYNKKVAATIESLVAQRDALLAAAKAALDGYDLAVGERKYYKLMRDLRAAIQKAEAQP